MRNFWLMKRWIFLTNWITLLGCLLNHSFKCIRKLTMHGCGLCRQDIFSWTNLAEFIDLRVRRRLLKYLTVRRFYWVLQLQFFRRHTLIPLFHLLFTKLIISNFALCYTSVTFKTCLFRAVHASQLITGGVIHFLTSIFY